MSSLVLGADDAFDAALDAAAARDRIHQNARRAHIVGRIPAIDDFFQNAHNAVAIDVNARRVRDDIDVPPPQPVEAHPVEVPPPPVGFFAPARRAANAAREFLGRVHAIPVDQAFGAARGYLGHLWAAPPPPSQVALLSRNEVPRIGQNDIDTSGQCLANLVNLNSRRAAWLVHLQDVLSRADIPAIELQANKKELITLFNKANEVQGLSRTCIDKYRFAREPTSFNGRIIVPNQALIDENNKNFKLAYDRCVELDRQQQGLIPLFISELNLNANEIESLKPAYLKALETPCESLTKKTWNYVINHPFVILGLGVAATAFLRPDWFPNPLISSAPEATASAAGAAGVATDESTWKWRTRIISLGVPALTAAASLVYSSYQIDQAKKAAKDGWDWSKKAIQNYGENSLFMGGVMGSTALMYDKENAPVMGIVIVHGVAYVVTQLVTNISDVGAGIRGAIKSGAKKVIDATTSYFRNGWAWGLITSGCVWYGTGSWKIAAGVYGGHLGSTTVVWLAEK